MKIIREKFDAICNILTVSKTAEGYQPSKFNVTEQIGAEYLVFNTLTRAMVLLSAEEYQKLSSVAGEETSDPIIQFFLENFFLVENTVDETQRYFQAFQLYRMLYPAPKKLRKVKIYTTTYCNARCFYCFEEGMAKNHMTLETAEDVVQYILANKSDKQLEIEWFGGEPLCNYKIIDYICDRLTEEKVDFKSMLITNGYLFNDELIARVVSKWKLSFVEITLDGTREEHNRRKAYVNPNADPYEKTMENIQKLAQLPIRVLVRLNFDQNNMENIKELIPIVIEKFRENKNVSISPAPLYENCMRRQDGYDRVERLKLYDDFAELNAQFIECGKAGYTPISSKLARNHCMGDNPATAVINTDGKLYTCQSCDDTMYYGDIYAGITQPDIINAWQNPRTVREKCVNCTFLPECTPFDRCPVDHEFCGIIKNYTLRRKMIATLEENS